MCLMWIQNLQLLFQSKIENLNNGATNEWVNKVKHPNEVMIHFKLAEILLEEAP